MPSTDFPVFTKTFHSCVYPSIDPTKAGISAQGRVVIVTGGGRGIGKAIAVAFTKAGAHAVVILGRTENTLRTAKDELLDIAHATGVPTIVRSFQADVADTQAITHVFEAVRNEFGRIDIVVNNAAALHIGTLEASRIDDYWRIFETNVKGTLNLMQSLARSDLDRDDGAPATFINISTVGLIMPTFPTWSNYVTTKLATFSMTQYLAAESGGKIRTFSVHPGRVATDMTAENGIPTFEEPGEYHSSALTFGIQN